MQTLMLLQEATEWISEGHAGPWSEGPGAWIVGLAVLGFVLLLVKCFALRGRYRAVDTISESDREALASRIAEAEKKTVGEIVVVVVERSDPHPGAPWVAAIVLLFSGSATLSAFLPWGTPLVLLVQLALASVGFLCAYRLADFRRLFIREARASAVAEEQALLEFHGNGVDATDERTGVLIFVSLFERRVVVLGDTGINERVGEAYWIATDKEIVTGIKRGNLVEGIDKGIHMCSKVLAEHFPWREGDRDELPNHVIVRRE